MLVIQSTHGNVHFADEVKNTPYLYSTYLAHIFLLLLLCCSHTHYTVAVCVCLACFGSPLAQIIAWQAQYVQTGAPASCTPKVLGSISLLDARKWQSAGHRVLSQLVAVLWMVEIPFHEKRTRMGNRGCLSVSVPQGLKEQGRCYLKQIITFVQSFWKGADS